MRTGHICVARAKRATRIACELLNKAEAAGMLEKAQRADVVDRVIREMHKSAPDPGPGRR